MSTLRSSGDDKLDALRQSMAQYGSWDERIDALVEMVRDWVAEEPMAPKQRTDALYDWTESDHCPGGFAFWSPRCLGIDEVSCLEYHVDAKKMYYCQLLGLARYKHDIPALFTDVYNYDVEAIGSKLSYPEDSMPEIVDFVIKEPKDLLKLRVPDPEKDARMPYVLEIGRRHREKLGDLFPTVLSTNAPFSLAVGLRSYTKLVRDMRKDPAFVHDLLEFCTQVSISFGKKIIEHAGLGPTLSDAWACPPNLSVQQVLEFVVPYTSRVLEALDHPGYFYAWGYSLAPDWRGFLRTINAMGVGTNCLFAEDILGMKGYEQVDLAEFAQICQRQKTVLFTNPHPDFIFNGPPELIRYYVLDWHKKASPGKGHAYYTSIPPDTPPAHIEAYVEALRATTYPVDEAEVPVAPASLAR